MTHAPWQRLGRLAARGGEVVIQEGPPISNDLRVYRAVFQWGRQPFGFPLGLGFFYGSFQAGETVVSILLPVVIGGYAFPAHLAGRGVSEQGGK